MRPIITNAVIFPPWGLCSRGYPNSTTIRLDVLVVNFERKKPKLKEVSNG